jgi:hypothetical protein
MYGLLSLLKHNYETQKPQHHHTIIWKITTFLKRFIYVIQKTMSLLYFLCAIKRVADQSRPKLTSLNT